MFSYRGCPPGEWLYPAEGLFTTALPPSCRSSALKPAHRRRSWVVASSTSSSNGGGPRMRPLQPGEAASEALRQPQVLKPANPNTVLMVYRGPLGPGASSSLSSGSSNSNGRQSSRPSSSAAAASSGAGGAVVLPLAQRGGQGAAATARLAEQEATFQRSMMVAGFDEGALCALCPAGQRWQELLHTLQVAGVHAALLTATHPATRRCSPPSRACPPARPPALLPNPIVCVCVCVMILHCDCCVYLCGADAAPLPMDYTYTWAQESYSRRQRTADTWRFVLTLRARLFLLDKPWSYPGAAASGCPKGCPMRRCSRCPYRSRCAATVASPAFVGRGVRVRRPSAACRTSGPMPPAVVAALQAG